MQSLEFNGGKIPTNTFLSGEINGLGKNTQGNPQIHFCLVKIMDWGKIPTFLLGAYCDCTYCLRKTKYANKMRVKITDGGKIPTKQLTTNSALSWVLPWCTLWQCIKKPMQTQITCKCKWWMGKTPTKQLTTNNPCADSIWLCTQLGFAWYTLWQCSKKRCFKWNAHSSVGKLCWS